MVEYNTVNAKLSESQLNKLNSSVKNKQGTTLRVNARMSSTNNLPHELLLTSRQTTKLRNAIENKMSTDIKLAKAQVSKIIQSGRSLGSLLSVYSLRKIKRNYIRILQRNSKSFIRTYKWLNTVQ